MSLREKSLKLTLLSAENRKIDKFSEKTSDFDKKSLVFFYFLITFVIITGVF